MLTESEVLQIHLHCVSSQFDASILYMIKECIDFIGV